MSWLSALCVLLPLLASALLWPLAHRPQLQWLSACLTTGVCALVASVLVWESAQGQVLVTTFGNWPAPFGITFVVDRLSALMTLVGSVLVLLGLIYTAADFDLQRARFGLYPFLLLLLAGFNGVVMTGDLFNLYVWLEVLLINSLALLVLGNQRPQLRSTIPYIAMNLIASTFILVGVGLIYSITGTLNLAELSHRLLSAPTPLLHAISVVVLVGLGVKAAVFPLFFWLPVAYPSVPIAVTATYSGLLTKVAVYCCIRLCTLLFADAMPALQTPLLVVAALTMVTGVLGAAAQFDLRRILSFHIISQIGYMVMGLALATPLALAGAVFFMVHNMVVKSNLFFISGVARRWGGTFELHGLGGLYTSHPWTSVLFLISGFALVGLPPLSGFWGKFMLIKAGLQQGQIAVTMVALLVSLLTLYSMTKIWLMAFWKAVPSRPALHSPWQYGSSQKVYSFVPIITLTILTLAPALLIGPMGDYAMAMAEQLLTPAGYVRAILTHTEVP